MLEICGCMFDVFIVVMCLGSLVDSVIDLVVIGIIFMVGVGGGGGVGLL